MCVLSSAGTILCLSVTKLDKLSNGQLAMNLYLQNNQVTRITKSFNQRILTQTKKELYVQLSSEY